MKSHNRECYRTRASSEESQRNHAGACDGERLSIGRRSSVPLLPRGTAGIHRRRYSRVVELESHMSCSSDCEPFLSPNLVIMGTDLCAVPNKSVPFAWLLIAKSKYSEPNEDQAWMAVQSTVQVALSSVMPTAIVRVAAVRIPSRLAGMAAVGGVFKLWARWLKSPPQKVFLRQSPSF